MRTYGELLLDGSPVSGGGTSVLPVPGFTPGRLYTFPWYNGSGIGTGTAAKDTLSFIPMVVAPGTIVSIGASLTSTLGSAGSLARLGIWEKKTGLTLEPGNLLLDAGTIPIDGSSGYHSITISQGISTARWIYLSIVHNSTTPVGFDTFNVSNAQTAGIFGTDSTYQEKPFIQAAFPYAALPANTTGLSFSYLSAVVAAVTISYS